MEENKFYVVIKSAMKVPGVKVNRESFLKKEFSKYFSDEQVNKAVYNQDFSDIDKEIIDKIAKGCINLATTEVTTTSFVAGLPGGLAMFGTIPADVAQYYAHVLLILQKLLYIYGWDNIFDNGNNIDDDTMNLIAIFMGVMFGVAEASKVITQVAASAGAKITKDLARKALTKTAIYPIVKNICKQLGVRMTKEIFAKGVGKLVPILGGGVSGTLTLCTFKPMANRLKVKLSDCYEIRKDNDENVIYL